VPTTPLVVLRHGPTDWTAAGRIQGRSDQPLSTAGRAAVRRWCLPEAFGAYRWVTSPLIRARETAAVMGHAEAVIEPALIETDWGQWEGQTLAELRDRYGSDMAAMEARGLEFRPPQGESPRDVKTRLRPWLGRVGTSGQPCVAVCHKGVIRALMALASGWDMTGPPPEKLRDATAHCLVVDGKGQPAIERLNLPLVP
jgi:probable phosphoglycerate mutase